MSSAPSPVYRETFLRDRFTPERGGVVRRFGAILEELTADAVTLLPRVGTGGELSAASVDLGFLAGLLEDNRRDDEPQLIRRALGWADRLRAVEAEIRQALGGEGGEP